MLHHRRSARWIGGRGLRLITGAGHHGQVRILRESGIGAGPRAQVIDRRASAYLLRMAAGCAQAYGVPIRRHLAPCSKAEQRISLILIGHEHDQGIRRHLHQRTQAGRIDFGEGQVLAADVEFHSALLELLEDG